MYRTSYADSVTPKWLWFLIQSTTAGVILVDVYVEVMFSGLLSSYLGHCMMCMESCGTAGSQVSQFGASWVPILSPIAQPLFLRNLKRVAVLLH